MKRRRKSRVMAEINITPFTDVVLVLLIIFMIATPFIYQSSMKVNLPQGSTNDELNKDIIITINSREDVYLDDTKLDLDTLRNRLMVMVGNEPHISVIVNGDKNVRYDSVMQVLDVLKQSGVRNQALGIELRR